MLSASARPMLVLLLLPLPLQAQDDDYSIFDLDCGGTSSIFGPDRGWVSGTIKAEKNLTDVSVTGFLQGQRVGTQDIGGILKGVTRQFRVSNNNMSLLPGTATCRVSVTYKLASSEEEGAEEEEEEEEEEEAGEEDSAVLPMSWGALKNLLEDAP